MSFILGLSEQSLSSKNQNGGQFCTTWFWQQFWKIFRRFWEEFGDSWLTVPKTLVFEAKTKRALA
jgi:hypothetical protein